MQLLERYIKTDYESYEDFYENFDIKIPPNFNFAYDIVDEWARLRPEKRALVWCNDDGESRVFTFGDIKRFSDKAANIFLSAGIKKGDHVMLILKRHYEFWFCVIALHKIGAVCVPATNLLTKKDLEYRFNMANIKAIVCTGEGQIAAAVDAAQTRELGAKFMCRGERAGWRSFEDELNKASESFTRPEGENNTENSDTSILYFTSGTTGQPKMVHHNFIYPLAHIITAKFWQNVRDDELHLTVSETGWAKSVWGKLYGQWICGAVVFVYDYSERFTPVELLHKIEQYKISTFCAPPTIYRFFIKEDLTKFDLSSLKYCVIAGEPLNPEIYEQFLKATNIKLREGFGQTESILSLATYPWIKPRPGSMGKPSPGYDVLLMDDEGNECAPGDIGQIVYNTAKRKPFGLFSGYYKDSALTDSVWHDGKYYTGDLAWRDEGGYYWYVGRSDDMIKSSGYRIGPFEVESALIEHPAVLETAITAVPDELRGQIVKATIILAKGYSPSDELKKELQDHVKKTTAPYKYPRIIEFVDSLPKTISGKIRRVELRDKDK